eukprot:CAMPEP_0116941532 /NCGR_PEP_ID=MMETSP0467-20121206/34041_1 /TAXON_ID=283647 /ORGANISM="Mesodinium pulex, Strain SPMC105" /LENGTH=75 /DNA_ID=CAMNT_0004624327 /DNA_START=1042 /DNA_END=1269 /DNA_ORIENTATION=-
MTTQLLKDLPDMKLEYMQEELDTFREFLIKIVDFEDVAYEFTSELSFAEFSRLKELNKPEEFYQMQEFITIFQSL